MKLTILAMSIRAAWGLLAPPPSCIPMNQKAKP